MSPLARICPHCGDAYTGPRCTSHPRQPTISEQAKRLRENYTAVYNTQRWRRTRRVVLHRAGHECELALTGCLGKATIAGHITPFSGADDPAAFDLANLRAECSRCSGSEAATRQARKRAATNHPGGTP